MFSTAELALMRTGVGCHISEFEGLADVTEIAEAKILHAKLHDILRFLKRTTALMPSIIAVIPPRRGLTSRRVKVALPVDTDRWIIETAYGEYYEIRQMSEEEFTTWELKYNEETQDWEQFVSTLTVEEICKRAKIQGIVRVIPH